MKFSQKSEKKTLSTVPYVGGRKRLTLLSPLKSNIFVPLSAPFIILQHTLKQFSQKKSAKAHYCQTQTPQDRGRTNNGKTKPHKKKCKSIYKWNKMHI